MPKKAKKEEWASEEARRTIIHRMEAPNTRRLDRSDSNHGLLEEIDTESSPGDDEGYSQIPIGPVAMRLMPNRG
jgi:hypothetical protein